MRWFSFPKTERVCYEVCGNLLQPDGFLHQRRVMGSHVLIFVLEGTLHLTQADVAYTVRAGEVFLLAAGEVHFGHAPSAGKLSYFWVHFSTSAPLQWNADEALVPPSDFAVLLAEHGTVLHPSRIRLLFQQLLDFSRRAAFYDPELPTLALRLLLMELTQELLDGSGDADARQVSGRVRAMQDWLRANCHRPLRRRDIAEAFHYNEAYLSALFKQETGGTLIAYLNHARVEVSKQLLAGQGVSIKEVAFSCGFRHEKYYMRIFRREVGMTPQQYQQAVAGG